MIFDCKRINYTKKEIYLKKFRKPIKKIFNKIINTIFKHFGQKIIKEKIEAEKIIILVAKKKFL